MKRLILILAWALLLLPAAGAQEPSKQLNKKNLVIKEWNSDPKGGNKVLDHITTFSADGKKIEEAEYGSEGQKWRKRFEYGPDGKVSRELVRTARCRANWCTTAATSSRPTRRSSGMPLGKRRCSIPTTLKGNC